MPAVTRKTDDDIPHCGPMQRLQGSVNVFVEGLGVSREGDTNTPHLLPGGMSCPTHSEKITTGSTVTKVNGKGIGRIGDVITDCTAVAKGAKATFEQGGGGGGSSGGGGGGGSGGSGGGGGTTPAAQTFIVALGDNITHNYPWVRYALNPLGLKTVIYAASGRTMINAVKDAYGDNLTSAAFTNASAVTIYIGINDFQTDNILGSLTDNKNTNTFTGHIKNVIETIRSFNTSVPIIFNSLVLSNLFSGHPNLDGSFTLGQNNIGLTQDNYSQRIKEVCSAYSSNGVFFNDMRNSSLITGANFNSTVGGGTDYGGSTRPFTGTVTLTHGSTFVTGNGTKFLTEFQFGYPNIYEGKEQFQVGGMPLTGNNGPNYLSTEAYTIQSDTQLTLTTPANFANTSLNPFVPPNVGDAIVHTGPSSYTGPYWKQYLGGDGIHPSVSGYELMQTSLRQFFIAVF